MRRTRWLFPVAILVILGVIGSTYLARVERTRKESPTPPKPLESGIDTKASKWHIVKSDGTRPVVEIFANDFRQVREPAVMQLEGVELHLFHKNGSQYDRVTCAKAEFSEKEGFLYSEGEVEIAMAVPAETEGGEPPPPARRIKIVSSGVRFESKSGKAETTRPAKFVFDEGDGSATGVDYDPTTRELHLRADVKLNWRGRKAGAKPMLIEAGEAFYKEKESKVFLMPWSRLTRDTLKMDAAMSIVTLEDGDIKLAESGNAKGVQTAENRKLDYSADQLRINFGENAAIQKIVGDRNAKLNSTSRTATTAVTADKLDMDFETVDKEAELKLAVATGKSVLVTTPVPRPGVLQGDTKTLRSEVVTMKMRAGGEEIESVETQSAAVVEFAPNRPGLPKRTMNGDRVWMTYGADNQIETFRSVNVTTRTDNPPKPPKPGQSAPPNYPAITRSKELVATFDPKNSQLSKLDQNGDFRYEEGPRKAQANRGTLDQAKDLMTLDTAARVSDLSGSTNADRIVINQKTNDFTADGNVQSTRLPDKQNNSAAMLNADEPMQARAKKMTSTANNQKIRYEGNAIAWQGANRIQADRIDIDREEGQLEAHGNVTSQFVDKAKTDDPEKAAATAKKAETKKSSKKKTQAPKVGPQPAVFTIVKAPDMTYSDEERVAHYTGGVILNRPGMQVKAREIKAFLKDQDEENESDSSLDKAIADGKVEIVQTTEKRKRTGTGEHAEYYTDDEKLIMEGGQPMLVDSLKGTTKGKQLTWFSNDDRLLVNGVEKAPAESTIRRK